MSGNSDFEALARKQSEGSFVSELWALIHQKKKYWLVPIVAVLVMLGFLVFLSGTAAAPFIYTLF